jgi:uncharacterized protein YybS (DUF2232 family)
VTKQVDGRPDWGKDLIHIVAWGMMLLLAGTLWMLFGWICFFFPLIVFVYIQKFGWQNTNKHLGAALPLAIIAGFFTQSVELIIFTALFLPAGYVIAHSAQHEEKPWRAGLKGWLALCGLFFIFFSVLSSSSEISFLQAITAALDAGIDEALRQYSQSSDLSAENYEILKSTLLQAKQTAPLILPAVLGSVFLLVIWTTLAVGNAVLPRFGCRQPWSTYKYWTLPEKLIWAFILFGLISAFGSGFFQKTGINCIILIALMYSFQGLAIVVFYLEKLNVPKFIRAVIYIMIILQSFGSILLAIAGIADVWFDLRRIGQIKNNRKSQAK